MQRWVDRTLLVTLMLPAMLLTAVFAGILWGLCAAWDVFSTSWDKA